MGAIGFFPGYGDDESLADVPGSSYGEEDGTVHRVEVYGGGRLILRVQLQGAEEAVDLLFDDNRAVAFRNAIQAVLRRLGLDK